MSVGMGLMSFVCARVVCMMPRRSYVIQFDLMVSSRGCDGM